MYTSVLGLVPIGSIWSLASIAGVIWLLVCLKIALNGWKGWLICLNLFFFGALVVGIWRVNPVPSMSSMEEENAGMAPYLKLSDGRFANERQLIRESDNGKGPRYNPDHYKNSKRYYRMHCVSGVPAWLWHPDALWVAPGLALVISLILSPLIMIITTANRARYAAKQAVNDITYY